MKKGLAFVIILVAFTSAFAQIWYDPIFVSDGIAPDLDVDPKTGYLHVLAVKDSTLIYTVMNEQGTQLSQEVVPGILKEKAEFYLGPSVAVDTAGFPHIAYRINVNPGDVTFDIFYIYKSESGWSEPVEIDTSVQRGYCARIDVDGYNQVHLAYGSVIGETVWGPVTYKKIVDGEIATTIPNLEKYRGDDRLEIDARGMGAIHLLLGSPDPAGGPVTYWRSNDGGESFQSLDNIISADAVGRNGSPDVFVDKAGKTHICYGTTQDASKGYQHSIRYAQFDSVQKTVDVAITPAFYLQDWDGTGVGLGSVAASDLGKHVVITFLKTDGGPLYVAHSSDFGHTWGAPNTLTSENFPGFAGRNKHVVRANGRWFHVVYPDENNQVWLRQYFIPDMAAPVANAGGLYSASEGAIIQFDASNSSDDIGIVSYQWDWNADAVVDDSSSSPVFGHAYPDDYTGNVILAVRDESGKTAFDTAGVTIVNSAPVPDSIAQQTGTEGQLLTFEGAFTDSGALDTHEFKWFFGDGDSAVGKDATHQFMDNGDFNVTFQVIDDDSGVGETNSVITILNVAPTAEAGGPYAGETKDTLTFIATATDPGALDTLFTFDWDLDADGNFETPGQEVTHSFPKQGIYYVILRATDKDSGAGIDTAFVTISGAGPVISGIESQTIAEGDTFDVINLDDVVSDPDNEDSEITWQVIGNQHLTVLIHERMAKVAPADSEWSGTEILTFIASDPDTHADSSNVAFIITPINDAPVALSIDDQTIDEGEGFVAINLNEHVFDPDNSPDELIWMLHGNKYLLVTLESGMNKAAGGDPLHRLLESTAWQVTIAVPDSEWAGADSITFVVTDSSGLSDSVSARFQVNAVNDPPVISPIPDQVIATEPVFPALALDEYVFDADHPDSVLVWSYTGNTELVVMLQNRYLYVEPPDAAWRGTEQITLYVSDPKGSTAQSIVNYTVNRDNAPPQFDTLATAIFNEDDTLRIPLQQLRQQVTDPDNNQEDFNFYLVEHENIFGGQVNAEFILSAAPNWYGTEIVKLGVSDGSGGRDTTDWRVTVSPQGDPPDNFSLVSPLDESISGSPISIVFKWRKSTDPDLDQFVGYILQLSTTQNFSDTLFAATTMDTFYTYMPNSLENGTYYWKVFAFSSGDLLFTVSDNIGQFTYVLSNVDALDEKKYPITYQLYQNRPNPFNPETVIRYSLPEDATIKLTIYNTLGQVVRQLENGLKIRGQHSIRWDGRDDRNQNVGSGIYIIRLETGQHVFSRKMLLAK
ncbi:PKD domain-containing protein [candidate division KSB1 bacterium]|nr:PKD domain-containing protein [candidate division KSB1 bacterium]